jgi:hypothetical protein
MRRADGGPLNAEDRVILTSRVVLVVNVIGVPFVFR